MDYEMIASLQDWVCYAGVFAVGIPLICYASARDKKRNARRTQITEAQRDLVASGIEEIAERR